MEVRVIEGGELDAAGHGQQPVLRVAAAQLGEDALSVHLHGPRDRESGAQPCQHQHLGNEPTGVAAGPVGVEEAGEQRARH